MARCKVILALGLFAALLPNTSSIAKGPAYTDPGNTDDDFAVQGEYAGDLDVGVKLCVQVIALGDGRFKAVPYVGGFPGSGWDGEYRPSTEGNRDQSGNVTFQGVDGTSVWRDNKLNVTSDRASGVLQKVHRKSPSLGEKPPEGSVVLFDGKSVENWIDGKMTSDGLLMQGTTSKQEFQSHRLHIEFRLPYQPEDRGQQRGNSGIYLQGRYEVQMLDSFGLEGKDNECGGIYTISAPNVNMCFPPLSWQTYDIDFVAAKFEGDRMIAKPRLTVRHNGVVVQKDVELPKSTTASPRNPGPEPGPVYLQDHSNPVRYRNIWVLPTDD